MRRKRLRTPRACGLTEGGEAIAEPRRSRVCVASFVLGIVSSATAILAALLSVTGASVGSAHPHWASWRADTAWSTFLVAVFASYAAALAGLALGLVEIREHGRGKRFAVAGTVISALVLAGLLICVAVYGDYAP